MKSIIAIIALGFCGSVSAASMQQLQQDAICQSNAAVFYAECGGQVGTSTPAVCVADITDEKTGQIQRGVVFNIPNKKQYTRQAKVRTYHEEDASGSTTIQINERTGAGNITMMDESSVTHTGNVKCKNYR